MVSGAGEWPKSLLTSPVCCLTLLAGEPSPACCLTDVNQLTAAAPPWRATARRLRRGMRDLAGWGYRRYWR